MKRVGAKLLSLLLTVVLVAMCALSGCGKSAKEVAVEDSGWKTNYTYVFCHGLSGWGSYDDRYDTMPYWGMRTGDMIETFNSAGFTAAAASVDPYGSAWDRACELYAQLTGTRVDYGVEHSKRCLHDRYGEDYTGRALIAKWSAKDKINLVGHSFGGATTRLFTALLANGSEAEQNATKKGDLSPLFEGGKQDWVYSVTSLAAPHNGTSAYNTPEGVDESLSWLQGKMAGLMSSNLGGDADAYPRVSTDYAHHDLQIDYAMELNKQIGTFDNIYYFSVPCSATMKQADGTWKPNDLMSDMFMNGGTKMGKYTGKTDAGFEITEEWLDNDGLVNTISATAPFTDPSRNFDPEKDSLESVKPGVWQVLPTFKGDHMSIIGGLLDKTDVLQYYLDFMSRINSL